MKFFSKNPPGRVSYRSRPIAIMKKPIIASAMAATCALAFTVLSSSAEPEDAKPWRVIAAGTQSAIETETRLVIQEADAWRKWWRDHTKNESDASNANEPPKVDFEKETVLVATLGMRSSGGHKIEFIKLRREGETLKVVVKATSPGPDDMVTMALTHPFAVIAIPKHAGPVEFVTE